MPILPPPCCTFTSRPAMFGGSMLAPCRTGPVYRCRKNYESSGSLTTCSHAPQRDLPGSSSNSHRFSALLSNRCPSLPRLSPYEFPDRGGAIAVASRSPLTRLGSLALRARPAFIEYLAPHLSARSPTPLTRVCLRQPSHA